MFSLAKISKFIIIYIIQRMSGWSYIRDLSVTVLNSVFIFFFGLSSACNFTLLIKKRYIPMNETMEDLFTVFKIIIYGS